VAGFRRRAKAEGITFANKSGRGLSLARAKGATAEVFERFRDEVMNPELMQFQLLHGVKLTLSDIVNFDEYRLDLCDFAGGNVYMTLAWFGNNILVPYERSPHITVITGFAGKVHLVTMVIRIGSQFVAPHPHHAQLLPRGPGENSGDGAGAPDAGAAVASAAGADLPDGDMEVEEAAVVCAVDPRMARLERMRDELAALEAQMGVES